MKTAEIAIIFIVGTLTLMVFVFFLVLIIIEYRRRQVRHITEKLELKHEYQNQVMQTQIEVQEQAFKYFSEEMHDNIAQILAMAKMKLYRVADKTTDEMVKTGIATTNELLGKTLDDIRSLSHVLNGNLISKIPLAESLEKDLIYVRDSAGIDATLTVNGDRYELDSEKKLLLFRIIQEAVGNAIKHGNATKINITLAYKKEVIIVEIHDNGKGFDTRLLDESKGLGLHNIQVRAKLLGTIEVVSAAGKGTAITLKINTNA